MPENTRHNIVEKGAGLNEYKLCKFLGFDISPVNKNIFFTKIT